jgi:hypothetical protein
MTISIGAHMGRKSFAREGAVVRSPRMICDANNNANNNNDVGFVQRTLILGN